MDRANGTRDPLEGINRATYGFNEAVDQLALKPIAETYTALTPQPVRTGISNFFDNLTYVNVILNDFLQGKFVQGVTDFWRLFFNTVFGFGGLYDVAATQGFEKHDEDFGQTLGVWGVGEGIYFVLPLFGPSTLRDAPGLAVEAVTNPLFHLHDQAIRIAGHSMQSVDKRARAGGALRAREETAIDPYIFTREAYLQRRRYLIYDGRPPTLDLYEDFGEEEVYQSKDEEY